MTNRAERITAILTQALQPIHLEVRDDSHRHAGHEGARPLGQTHYSIIIEAEYFKGMRKLQCHRAIYTLLDEEFRTGLHALAIEVRGY